MKHAFAIATCAVAAVTSLTACAGSDTKAALPTYTGTATPSTVTTKPATQTPAASRPKSTDSAGDPLATHSTYTYGGLNVVVDLPSDIPRVSRPSMRVFSEFLQADARTSAGSKLDPRLADLASPNVVKDTKAAITPGSTQGIGLVKYTVSKVESAGSGFAFITGCLDQSKIAHTRKDGSRFVDPNAQKNPTLAMVANINLGETGLKVTRFTFGPPC